MGQASGEVWMEPGEHPLQYLAGKHALQDFIARLSGSQSISMSNQEFFPAIFPGNGFPVHIYANFLWQVVKNPDVMIACEQIDSDACICDLGNLTKETGKSAWHNFFIFKPVIKNIPQKVNLRCFAIYLIEPLNDQFFPFHAFLLRVHAKVEIGDKKYFLLCCQGLGWFVQQSLYITIQVYPVEVLSYDLALPVNQKDNRQFLEIKNMCHTGFRIT